MSGAGIAGLSKREGTTRAAASGVFADAAELALGLNVASVQPRRGSSGLAIE